MILLVMMIGLLGAFARWRRIWGGLRAVIVLAVLVVVWTMASGSAAGFAFLWLYTLPLIVFFLFGKREGTIWVVSMFVILGVLFFGGFGFHAYASDLGLRFLTTFAIVSALAFGLEASRDRYFRARSAEKAALEQALEQVHKLHGLLPICASCKSVRDSRGLWNRIETYLGRHSAAELSRSLCPECRSEDGGRSEFPDPASGQSLPSAPEAVALEADPDLWRFAPAGASLEERRRRTYSGLGLVLIIPTLAVFGLEDLRQGSRLEGGLVLTMALFLTGILILLPRVHSLTGVFRAAAAFGLALLLYVLAIGGGGGFSLVWFYIFPLLILAVFGGREGAAWALVAQAGSALICLTPLGHEYELGTALRFQATYGMVSILAFGLESARQHMYSSLLGETAALERTLARVKTLRGLLPICVACKKVRDDEGYWQEIEDYVGHHAQTEFSHGLCPNCTARIYPSLVAPQASAAGRPGS